MSEQGAQKVARPVDDVFASKYRDVKASGNLTVADAYTPVVVNRAIDRIVNDYNLSNRDQAVAFALAWMCVEFGGSIKNITNSSVKLRVLDTSEDHLIDIDIGGVVAVFARELGVATEDVVLNRIYRTSIVRDKMFVAANRFMAVNTSIDRNKHLNFVTQVIGHTAASRMFDQGVFARGRLALANARQQGDSILEMESGNFSV